MLNSRFLPFVSAVLSIAAGAVTIFAFFSDNLAEALGQTRASAIWRIANGSD